MQRELDQVQLQRELCWREFCEAVDGAVAGNYAAASALVERHPNSRGELRSFIAAIRAGRMRKTGDGTYVQVRQ